MAEFAQLAVVQALAGALMHFLWQGAVVALAAFTLMRVARGAGTRYAIGIGALVAMLAAPTATFLILLDSRSELTASAIAGAGSETLGAAHPADRRAIGAEPTASPMKPGGPWRACSSGCRGFLSCPCASPADGSLREGWPRVPCARPPLTCRLSRPRWPNGWRFAARYKCSNHPRWRCPCSSGGSGLPWYFPLLLSPA